MLLPRTRTPIFHSPCLHKLARRWTQRLVALIHPQGVDFTVKIEGPYAELTGAVLSHPAAIACAACGAVRVPPKQSGAITTRTMRTYPADREPATGQRPRSTAPTDARPAQPRATGDPRVPCHNPRP